MATSVDESIAFAQHKLCAAREDGKCADIVFWAKRVDELLDRKLAERQEATT